MDVQHQNAMNFFINNILTDSSSSSDTSDGGIRAGRRPRIKNFEAVIDSCSDEEFQRDFRVTKDTYSHILNLIRGPIESGYGECGRNTVSAEKQLYLALWYFATPDSYRSICKKFDVGNATAARAIHRVTEALLALSNQIIKWPTGPAIHTVRNGFARLGFPDTIGCIDGSYIPIPMPTDNGIAYICRKNFSAMILQCVCDHSMKFIHCYAGEVGSVHDAKVLKNSEVWSYMTTNAEEKFPNNIHLLGDKAYPLSQTLLVPYKNYGILNDQQQNFNYKLSASRSTIERAFALLKQRWRCLKFLDVRTIEWIPKYIIACCILHNICLMKGDRFEELVAEIPVEPENEDVGYQERRGEERERRVIGVQKRDRIANELFNLL